MKTDSDYLWDKTGEPDPEIQQLEEILGTLRYQPRPLEIPAGLSVGQAVGRERSFFRSSTPRLAIAATIAMVLIGLGVWLAWQRSERSQDAAPPQVAKSTDQPAANPAPADQPAPKQDQSSTVAASSESKEPPRPPRRNRRDLSVNQSLVAKNINRERNEARKAKELQEAALAKDQLMLALRVTSAKLSFAQKKTQSTNPPEPVHNQHKIG